jgi:four helix bundle protein
VIAIFAIEDRLLECSFSPSASVDVGFPVISPARRLGTPRAHLRGMTPDELRARTKTLALEVLKVSRRLTAEPARSMALQLSRAATSVGANYRAVCRARSHADFIAKLGITIEEIDEVGYWLEVLSDSGFLASNDAAPLRKEAEDLTRILVASRRTARANHQSVNRK